MQLLSMALFCIIVIVVLSVTIGIIKQQLRQNNQELKEGKKIDKIIRDNSDLSDDEWFGWLQERRDKQG